jgi:hypothetical protein
MQYISSATFNRFCPAGGFDFVRFACANRRGAIVMVAPITASLLELEKPVC